MLQTDLRGSNQPFAGSAVLGIRAMGIFLIFGGSMASLAGIDLVWQGAALDRMWALNPRAYNELVPFGKAAGFAFMTIRRPRTHENPHKEEHYYLGLPKSHCV